MNSKAVLGSRGEQAVQEVYIKRGYEILDQNYFNKTGKQFGEIDFIALKDGHIRFVEVKTRSSHRFGEGSESITRFKRQRLCRIIKFFLVSHRQFSLYFPHIDVVSVLADRFDKQIRKITIYSDAIDVEL